MLQKLIRRCCRMSDQVLHGLPMSHKIDVRLIWVNFIVPLCLHSYIVGLQVLNLVLDFIFFHILYIWAVKALLKQHECAVSSEFKLLADAICMKISSWCIFKSAT